MHYPPFRSPSVIWLFGLLVTCLAGCSGNEPILCQDVTCSGHGRCELIDSEPACACDTGYIASEVNRLTCIPVDTQALNRPLDQESEIGSQADLELPSGGESSSTDSMAGGLDLDGNESGGTAPSAGVEVSGGSDIGPPPTQSSGGQDLYINPSQNPDDFVPVNDYEPTGCQTVEPLTDHDGDPSTESSYVLAMDLNTQGENQARQRFLFLARVELDLDSTPKTIAMTAAPLDLGGEAPANPLALTQNIVLQDYAFQASGVALSDTGVFVMNFGQVTIPATSNQYADDEIIADIVITGEVNPFFGACGWVYGDVVSPTPKSLSAPPSSFFGMSPIFSSLLPASSIRTTCPRCLLTRHTQGDVPEDAEIMSVGPAQIPTLGLAGTACFSETEQAYGICAPGFELPPVGPETTDFSCERLGGTFMSIEDVAQDETPVGGAEGDSLTPSIRELCSANDPTVACCIGRTCRTDDDRAGTCVPAGACASEMTSGTCPDSTQFGCCPR